MSTRLLLAHACHPLSSHLLLLAFGVCHAIQAEIALGGLLQSSKSNEAVCFATGAACMHPCKWGWWCIEQRAGKVDLILARSTQAHRRNGAQEGLGISKSHLDQKHHLSGGLICGDGVEGLLELAHLHLDAHACRQAQQLQLVLQAESAHIMTGSWLLVLHCSFWPGLQAGHPVEPCMTQTWLATSSDV